jgi:hypothetical protein
VPRLLLLVAATLAIAAASGWTPPARAARLAGAELEVLRRVGAQDCPDDAALTRSVSALGTAPPARPTESLRAEVIFERDENGYVATIRSFGRKAGLRRLTTTANDCSSLADAVSVALAILFDLIPATEPQPETRASEAARAEEPRPPFTFAVGVRAGAGYAVLGDAVSGVFSGVLRLSRERFQLLGAVFWTTPHENDFSNGFVHAGLWGGGLDACFRLGSNAPRAVAWSPCAGFRLGRLSARGEEFDRNYVVAQTWAAVVAGGNVRLPLTKKWSFVVGLSALVPLYEHVFSVAGAGTAFESQPLAVLLGLGPEISIW